MKSLLAVTAALALTATSYAADKTTSAHYILIYPSSTIETDLSGHSVRVANASGVLVYLPINGHGDFADSLEVAGKRLKVSECAPR